MTPTRTATGWRLMFGPVTVDLTSDEAADLAATISGRPTIQRYTTASPAKARFQPGG